MDSKISACLAALRQEHGYSQEALAAQLGVSRQAVSKWERGDSSPDTDNLIALARLYGVTIDSLIFGEEGAAHGGTEGQPAASADQEAACSPGAGEGDAGAAANTVYEYVEATVVEEEPASAASENRQAPGANACEPSDGEAGEGGTGEPSGAPAADPGTPDSADARDHVNINWVDGINVHDKSGNRVHVGWDGIHVEEQRKNSYVHVDPSGVHVDDGAGNSMHGAPGEGCTVNGRHYSSWREAHEEYGHHQGAGWRAHRCTPVFPLILFVCILALLCLGILANQWVLGVLALLSAPVWSSLFTLIRSFACGAPSLVRRNACAGFVGFVGVYSFFVVGFLLGLWHPGWLLVLWGFAMYWIIRTMWPVRPAR